MTPFHARVGNHINWYGLWTLYCREVTVSIKFAGHTLFAPMVTGLLFLAVFGLSLSDGSRLVAGVPFLMFLGPGLVMMGLVHAAFEGAAISILHAKVDGTIIYVLMPPLGPLEFVFGHVLGGATRGVLVGAVMLISMQPFVQLVPVHLGFVLFHAVSASLALASIGLITGLWAQKWDHLALIGSFIIAPLAFLSGVFYSSQSLPEIWRTANLFNPFFYMVDGFRYGFIGYADASPLVGIIMVIGLNIVLLSIGYGLVATGYRLKS